MAAIGRATKQDPSTITLLDAERNISRVLASHGTPDKRYLGENFAIKEAAAQQAPIDKLVEKVKALFAAHKGHDKGRLSFSILDKIPALYRASLTDAEQTRLEILIRATKEVFQRVRVREIPDQLAQLAWLKQMLEIQDTFRKFIFSTYQAEASLLSLGTFTPSGEGEEEFSPKEMSVETVTEIMSSTEGLALLARWGITLREGKVYCENRHIESLMQQKDFPKIERLIGKLRSRFPCIHALGLLIELERYTKLVHPIDC